MSSNNNKHNDKISLNTDYDNTNNNNNINNIEIRESKSTSSDRDRDTNTNIINNRNSHTSNRSSRSSTRLTDEDADRISIFKKTITTKKYITGSNPVSGLVTTLNNKLEDQNFMQIKSLIFQVTFESYKAITSSMLILFVTQSCSDSECSIQQNLYHSDYDDDHVYKKDFYIFGLYINFFTLLIFTILYIFEIRREIYLIKYLEENQETLNDIIV